MSTCLLCAGCMPGQGSSIGSDGICSGENCGTDSSGGGSGGGGDVTPPEPVYESNNFSNKVYALVNRSGDESVFRDYYRSNVTFDELVDRQIGIIATEIVERLNDIYGRDNYKYSYDTNVSNFTTWQEGEARGEEYKVYSAGDTYYVFLRDKNGKMIPATGDSGEYFYQNTGFYKTVYFRSNSDNNMEEYMGNASCQALASYLLNNNVASDTYGEGNNTTYDINEQKLSILAGSIYGDNAYVPYGNEISLEDNQSRYAWNWSSYFEDGTAIDRLKYAIAKIIINNGYTNRLSQVDSIYYGNDYDKLVADIPFVANYLDYYYDAISRYVTNVVVGSDIIDADNSAISSLASVLEKAEDYNKTFEYAINDYFYKGCCESTLDIENRNENNINYRLCDLYNEVNLFTNYWYINNNNGTRTFEEEYQFLMGILKIQADTYMTNGNNYYKPYYDLYYGIDGLGYIDEAMTMKSVCNIDFPYTMEAISQSKNIKNYDTIISSVLNAVKNQTFSSDTHAAGYDSSLVGHSVYGEYYRVNKDNNITTLSGMGNLSNGKVIFNSTANYNSFIIPARGNVKDLSHYSMQIYVGGNSKDISLEIKVQTVDDTANSNIVTLSNSHAQSTSTMANGKFVVKGNASKTWNMTFDLPKLTTIQKSGAEYNYIDGSMYDNNQTLTHGTNGVTYGVNGIKDSLIVTVTAYDSQGRTVDLDTKFGVYIVLTNNYQIN